MSIEFDPDKDRANRSKHGMSLADAGCFDWDNALIREDRTAAYGAIRYRAIGFIGLRMCTVVFTHRGENVRIISLRKATRAEEELWADQ